MRIGIDIDNVISSFNDSLLKEYIKHDKEITGNGIINTSVYLRRGMFDWKYEEEQSFYKENIERIVEKLDIAHNAKEVIDKLKQDGNEIYIITGRANGDYVDALSLTKKWLEEKDIYYDKLLLTNASDEDNKLKECIEYNIDIMIDDSVSICKKLKENGVNVWLMTTRYNKDVKEFERVSSWREIYEKISSLYPKKDNTKINVILDTDTDNECDDLFAIAYMLKSQDVFNVEAITIAPYHIFNDISIEEGLENSYNEVIKICDYVGFDTNNKVFKGSTDYMKNGYNKLNEAVDKIIEICLKNEKTYIMAIGAITNIAIAISKEPKIVDKIEIIWLGGNSILTNKNNDFNFRQDIKAVETIFESKVKLTIIPCKNVASNLVTSIYELEHYLKDNNELGNYLCQRFYNDGKHGIQARRVIWDISVVAYLINKNWFEEEKISCPNINNDTSYDLNTNNHLITMVKYIDVNKVYEDMFNKLGK